MQSPDPPSLDTSHLNLVPFRKADHSLWERQGMAHLLRRILRYRGEFFRGMLTASTPGEVQAKCSQFSHQISCWLESLDAAVMKLDGVARPVRKATRLLLKHRTSGLTYRDALKELGDEPNVTHLMRVRRSMKELWYIFNIAKY